MPIVRRVGKSMDFARSKSISHFAPRHLEKQDSAKPHHNPKDHSDIGPTKHPLAKRVEEIRALKNKSLSTHEAPKSFDQTKNLVISAAIEKMPPKRQAHKQNIFKKYKKFFNVTTISLSTLVIIGCLILFYLPTVSLHIAGARANIDASYPEYHPDGYKFKGPVSFKSGQVSITFTANTGNTKFTINQTKSSWDSSAVRDMVNIDSKGEFIATEEKGLTVYTYSGNAAWVNGGILFTINGDAPLSGDQIRRIAVSL